MSTPPVTLLESLSPYGSRKVTVEYDGLTTAAYLHDDATVVSATVAGYCPSLGVLRQASRTGQRGPHLQAYFRGTLGPAV